MNKKSLKKEVEHKIPQKLAPEKNSEIEAHAGEGQSRAALLAQTATRPTVQAALTLEKWTTGCRNLDSVALINALSERSERLERISSATSIDFQRPDSEHSVLR